MQEWYDSQRVTPPGGEPANGEEAALSRVGRGGRCSRPFTTPTHTPTRPHAHTPTHTHRAHICSTESA